MFGGGEADTVQPHHLHDLSLLSLYRCSSSECGPQLLWLIGRNVIRCNDIQRRIYFISWIRGEKPFEVWYTNNCTAVDVTWKLFRPHVSLVPLPSSSWSIWFDLIWSPTSKVLLIGCLAERGHLSLLNPPSAIHLPPNSSSYPVQGMMNADIISRKRWWTTIIISFQWHLLRCSSKYFERGTRLFKGHSAKDCPFICHHVVSMRVKWWSWCLFGISLEWACSLAGS